MAFVEGAQILAAVPQKSGITLAIVPSSDPTCDVEIYRKIATAGTSAYGLLAALSAQQIGGHQYTYWDPVPVDGKAWDYTGRHTAAGRSPSTFCTSVRRKAGQMPTVQPPIPQLSGRGMPGDVFLSTGTKFKLGTNQAPRAITSTMYFPYSGFNPETSTHKLLYNFGELRPDNIFTEQRAQMGIPLPAGVIITQVSMRAHRAGVSSTAADVVEVKFRRGNTTGGNTVLATLTHSSNSGNYVTVNSSVMNETASTNPYFVGLRFRNLSGVLGAHASIVWVKVRYTRSSYDKMY